MTWSTRCGGSPGHARSAIWAPSIRGATGVLPLVIGRATRLAQFFTRNDKIYQGVIHFGYSTDSYDVDGAATSPELAASCSTASVLESAARPVPGEFEQMPPPVSAKKIAGRPAYELARKDQPVNWSRSR